MNKISIFLLLLFLNCNALFSQSDFGDSIFVSNDRFAVFVINVCQNNEENKYIIKGTHALNNFLVKQLKMDFQDNDLYKTYISNLIQNNECLFISADILIPWSFKKIVDYQEVDSVAQYGKDIFIEYFFTEYGRIKKEKIEYEYAAFNKLFEWGVALSTNRGLDIIYIDSLRKKKRQ